MTIVYFLCAYIAISYLNTIILMSCINNDHYSKIGLWTQWHIVNIIYVISCWYFLT